MGAPSSPLGCFAVTGQGRNARNAKSRHAALSSATPPPPPALAAPRFSVPSQEQDIHPSDIHSHTSCYQEKTLSQRLEWALINRVATRAFLVGLQGKRPLTMGYGQAGSSGMELPGPPAW